LLLGLCLRGREFGLKRFNKNFIKACAILPELIYLDDRSEI
jgi:hypothetical protein